MAEIINRIFRYPLAITDYQTVKMPAKSKVLTAQIQKGELFVWAMVDPSEPSTVDYPFWIHGTGHPVEEMNSQTIRYISTVQPTTFGQSLVFHVFVGLNA